MTLIEDLRSVLEQTDEFKAKWGFNPHDNYVWREYMVVDYMNKYYPTFTKRIGRHGSDSFCEELSREKIEIKSVKVKRRKKTNDFNLLSAPFFFDRQERPEFRERAVESDAYIFAVFDAEHSGHPVGLLFSHESNKVESIKDLIRQKQQTLLSVPKSARNERDTIILKYEEVMPFCKPYGEQQATLFEFLI